MISFLGSIIPSKIAPTHTHYVKNLTKDVDDDFGREKRNIDNLGTHISLPGGIKGTESPVMILEINNDKKDEVLGKHKLP